MGIAVIGCGIRGNDRLNELFGLRDERAEVVALCDVWRVNLEATADRVEKRTGRRPRTVQRFSDVLAMPEVDAVFITTPDFAHCPILKAAAEAKKHAYVEKPLGNRLEDVIAAVDAVEASGIVCQAGTQRRSEGQHRAAAKLIQSGVLGTLIQCDCAWHDNSARWIRPYDDVKPGDLDWEQYLMGLPPRPYDPRFFRLWQLYKETTVGLVGLLGSHLIDIATWYANDPLPDAAVGMGAKIVWTEREHDDTQECLLHYPKNFIVRCSSRLGNSRRVPENIFYGTKGSFDTDTWEVRGEGGGKGKVAEAIPVTPEPSEGHVANWLRCIRAADRNTNAPIAVGYAHAVASILASRACDSGRRLRYDAGARNIVEG